MIKKVPFILTNTYTLWQGKILNKQVYFAVNKGEELLTPDQFRKQTDLLENIVNEPVILVLKGMESYNRNRLIQKKVNFILEKKQMFLPDLLVDLKDYLKPGRAGKSYGQRLSPFSPIRLKKPCISMRNFRNSSEY